MLESLPADAYGQVYVEVASSVRVEPLARPARVAVTWLVRDPDGATGPRGELLVRAVDGWAAEWMTAPDPRRVVWIGCAAGPEIAERYRRLRAQPALEIQNDAVLTDGIPANGVLTDRADED